MEITRLTAADCAECVDFLNMVYSMAYGPTDFSDIQSRLYRSEEELMRRHFAVKDGGRIRAVVGLFPSVIQVGEVELRLSGIGSVAVHPADRGRGYMKLLMGCCLEEMRREGCDLSFLSGLRQRYGYFGYERAGQLLTFNVSKTNLRHYKSSAPELTIRPVTPEERALLREMKRLHDAQPVRCLRSMEDFYYYLLTEDKKPYAGFYPDGGFAGYLTASGDFRQITELFAPDNAAFDGLIRAYFREYAPSSAVISLPPWELDHARFLAGFAEYYSLRDCQNWRIFNWARVTEAFLRVKAGINGLRDGKLNIGVEGCGTLTLTVRDGEARCILGDAAPELSLTALDATRLIFGNLPVVYGSAAGADELIRDWFPLPLCWLPQNHV